MHKYIYFLVIFLIYQTSSFSKVSDANKFDQMSTITNFVITPLAFLSGSFYSIEALPDAVRQLAYYNPLFYLIDGTRYSILGISDSNPTTGFTALTCCALAVYFWAWRMLNTGYRLKP